VRVDLRVKPSAGLGAYPAGRLSLDDVAESPSRERWIKAQDRYAKLDTTSTDGVDPVDLQTSAASGDAVGQIKWVKGQQN